MPTRKIRDLAPEENCRNPDHDPPTHRLFDNGVWEHECPGCHRKIKFTVRRPRCFLDLQQDSPFDVFGHQDVERKELSPAERFDQTWEEMRKDGIVR